MVEAMCVHVISEKTARNTVQDVTNNARVSASQLSELRASLYDLRACSRYIAMLCSTILYVAVTLSCGM